jgi:elongation factor P
MNTETYEQVSLPAERVDRREYIKEGGVVDILFHAETEQVLTTQIANHVEVAVVETDPGVRGDTATGATKPAKVESGAVVNVPLFINEGDVIRVSTETGAYLTRVSTA